VREVCPDLAVEGLLRRTGKTVLLAATAATGEPAVAKVLTDRTEFGWASSPPRSLPTARSRLRCRRCQRRGCSLPTLTLVCSW
jgi:hypothetical protein